MSSLSAARDPIGATAPSLALSYSSAVLYLASAASQPHTHLGKGLRFSTASKMVPQPPNVSNAGQQSRASAERWITPSSLAPPARGRVTFQESFLLGLEQVFCIIKWHGNSYESQSLRCVSDLEVNPRRWPSTAGPGGSAIQLCIPSSSLNF